MPALDAPIQSFFAKKAVAYLLLAAGALVLAAIILSPILRTGFYGDDAPNSAKFSRDTLRVQGTTLSAAIVDDQRLWLENGRFFPGTAYTPVLFYVVNGHPRVLKVIVLTLVLVGLALLGYLTTRLTGSGAAGVLAILIWPLLYQYRAGYDPVLAFAGLLPLVMVLTLASLLALVEYLDGGKRRFLVASLIAYAVALLTYEIAIPFFLLHFCIVWLYPNKRPFRHAVRSTAPFAAIAVVPVLAALGLRAYFSKAVVLAGQTAAATGTSSFDVSAYVIHPAPLPAIAVVLKQMLAVVPLSYWSISRPVLPGFAAGVGNLPAFNTVLAISYALVTGVALWLAWREARASRSGIRAGLLAILGAGLLVLPNVLIALSSRYQSEIQWGSPYLPAYVSVAGGVLLVVVICLSLARVGARATPSWPWMVVLILSVSLGAYVAAGNLQRNKYVVEVGERNIGYSQELVRAALRAGLMRDVPSNSSLIIQSPAYWSETPEFYSGVSGRLIRAIYPANTLTDVVARGGLVPDLKRSGVLVAPPDRPLFYLAFASNWGGNGLVTLGRVEQVASDGAGNAAATLATSYAYIAASPEPRTSTEILPKYQYETVRAASVDELGMSSADFDTVSSGVNWVIVRSRYRSVMPMADTFPAIAK